MTGNILKDKKLPDGPGVYRFLGSKKEILYIGKATSLRDRVKSYFSQDILITRGPKISKMLTEARSVVWDETDSVLEALVLEAHLIKKHQPEYNSREKDDKSFNYVVITNEDFSQLLVVRGTDLHQRFDEDEIKYTFGPFPSGGQFKEALRLIRKIFPWRDQKCTPGAGRPCFNRQIKLCPGVCTGEIGRREYGRLVQHLRLFFEGRKSALIRRLEREMKEYARKEEFEKAKEVKRKLFALTHIQDVSLLKREIAREKEVGYRIEGFDVAHMKGESSVGVMTVVVDGQSEKGAYRKFRLRRKHNGNDISALTELFIRRLTHREWPLPRLFVIDGGKTQKRAMEEILSEAGISVPIVSVVKDERHRQREIVGMSAQFRKHEHDILLVNMEAHRFSVNYHRSLFRKQQRPAGR